VRTTTALAVSPFFTFVFGQRFFDGDDDDVSNACIAPARSAEHLTHWTRLAPELSATSSISHLNHETCPLPGLLFDELLDEAHDQEALVSRGDRLWF